MAAIMGRATRRTMLIAAAVPHGVGCGTHRSWSGWFPPGTGRQPSEAAPTVAPMCGRYAATKNQGDLVEEFEVEVDATGEPTRAVMTRQQNPPAGQPDYNVAPTKKAPVVLSPAAARPTDRRRAAPSASSGWSTGGWSPAGPRT